MRDDLDWYRRFGDIPGISYETPPGLSPERLRGFGMKPELLRYESGASLWWGDTTESPSSAHAIFDSSRSANSLVKRMHEVLELPGTASDYHFALAGAVGSLFGLRAADPSALEAMERFCWLDIELIEARPEAFLYEDAEGSTAYYGFPSMSRLITLYSTEGYLREALAVVEKAERFGQASGQQEKLAARLAAVEVLG